MLTTISIAALLATKFTWAYLTETVLNNYIDNKVDNIISDGIPKISNRILAHFKNTEKPIDVHLQKAILSSHWFATRTFAEELKKQSSSPIFENIINVSETQINNLKRDDYTIKNESPDFSEIEKLFKNTKDEYVLDLIKSRAIEFHLGELSLLLTTTNKNNPDYIKFQNTIKNGISNGNNNTNLIWFELACSFFSEFLKGDNNKVKDAFQNQELVKIYLGIEDLKQHLLIGVERLAQGYIQQIGDEQYSYFVKWLHSDIELIKHTLGNIGIDIKEIRQDLLEIKETITKPLELDVQSFPDYQFLINDINELEANFAERLTEKQEIQDVLAEEIVAKKINLHNNAIRRIDRELLIIDENKTKKKQELSEFENNIHRAWLSLYAKNAPNSQRLNKARELFEKGDLMGANASLDKESLLNDSAQLLKADEYLKQSKEILSQEFLTKANLTLLVKSNSEWYQEVKGLFKDAIKLNQTYQSHFKFACFLQEHDEFDEAVFQYEQALMNTHDDVEKADVLNNWAVLLRNNIKLNKAKILLNKILKIYKDLKKQNPQKYLVKIAVTLNNLGNLYRQQENFLKAEENLHKALKIFEKLDKKHPQIYKNDICETLINLAVLYKASKVESQLKKVEKLYLIVLEIYRGELKNETSELILRNMIITQNNLGNFYYDLSRFEESKNIFEEALKSLNDLVANNPRKYLPYLAGTLNNIGLLEVKIKVFKKAKKSFEQSLKIRKLLAKQYPNAYQMGFAETLINFADFYLNNEQNKKKSLIFSQTAYLNAFPYLSETPLASNLCNRAIKIWKDWGEDLITHLKENGQIK